MLRAKSRSGGIFDFEGKQDRLREIDLTLADPDVWDDPGEAQALNKERAQLETVVETLVPIGPGLEDLAELAELSADEDDADTLTEIAADLDRLEAELEALEFRRMFRGEMDGANAFLEIQAEIAGTSSSTRNSGSCES